MLNAKNGHSELRLLFVHVLSQSYRRLSRQPPVLLDYFGILLLGLFVL